MVTRSIASESLEPFQAAKQPGQRGGVWSLGEVLAELLPRYEAPQVDRPQLVPLPFDEQLAAQGELVACG